MSFRRICAVLALMLAVAACTEASEPDIEAVNETPRILTVIGAGQSDGSLVGGDDLRNLWARRLYQQLPRETVYVNLADSGATVAIALETQVPAAVELEPSLVAVWLVTADVEAATPRDAYEASLAELVATFGDAEVLLLTGWVGRDPAAEAPYVESVRTVASTTGAQVVDLTSIDAESPDAEQLVADAVLAAIEAA